MRVGLVLGILPVYYGVCIYTAAVYCGVCVYTAAVYCGVCILLHPLWDRHTLTPRISWVSLVSRLIGTLGGPLNL